MLLLPLVRFALRLGLEIRDFEQLARRAYVRAAQEDLARTRSKATTCRLSVLTGIYRKEVESLLEQLRHPTSDSAGAVFARVIGQWEQHSDYRKRDGTPKLLSYQGEDSDFYRLVRQVTKQYHPSSLLAEFERNGAAIRTPKGLKLVRSTMAMHDDALRSYELVADDFESLLRAAEQNLQLGGQVGNLQHRTEYDNIYVDDLPEIRQWLLQEGRGFHKRVRDFLSLRDRDLTPPENSLKQAGAKVVLSVHSLTTKPLPLP